MAKLTKERLEEIHLWILADEVYPGQMKEDLLEIVAQHTTQDAELAEARAREDQWPAHQAQARREEREWMRDKLWTQPREHRPILRPILDALDAREREAEAKP